MMQASMDVLDRFEDRMTRSEELRELAEAAQIADAARDGWLAYTGDDYDTDVALYNRWLELRARYKALRSERWHLLESSAVLPDYAGQGG